MHELQDENYFARKAFENNFFFLGAKHLNNSKRGRGFGAAFDVWDEKDVESHQNTLATALTLFQELYGYKAKVFTPPAMFYNPTLEAILVQQDIKWLDVGRFFKIPFIGGGERYQYNYLGRKKKSGLKVVVRNAMFESNMSATDNGVSRCMHDIEESFKAKQPALISNHRASFVGGIDIENRNKGLKALDQLFNSILQKWPDVEFISINDLQQSL
jgi:alpha-amylase/alpha-mannosidase (GH57 family)